MKTEDIVLSSRVRLARNYPDLPFPARADAEAAKQVVARVRETLGDASTGEVLRMVAMEELSPLDRQVLAERHFVSPDFLKRSERAVLASNHADTLAIMVNEEDHLRIQAILPGLQIGAAWKLASEADDRLERAHPFAFDETFGYLSACPTNAGTGMRASVMLHLPALEMIGYMAKLPPLLAKLGMTLRGIYGEGSEALGSLYQVSNQVSLGPSEEDMLRNLEGITRQLIEKEQEARNNLVARDGAALEDRCWRALGILTHARRLDTKEAMQRLSDVRLGIEQGYLAPLDIAVVNELLIQVQPAGLQRLAGRELNAAERDAERARLCRERLESVG